MRMLIVAAAFLAAACQTKPEGAAPAVQPTRSTASIVSYACADGTVFTAVTKVGGSEVELKFADGTSLVLPQVEAASGAKYMTATHEFWSKGEEAAYTVGRRAPTACTVAK